MRKTPTVLKPSSPKTHSSTGIPRPSAGTHSLAKKPPASTRKPVRDGATGEYFKQPNVPPGSIHPYSGGTRIR